MTPDEYLEAMRRGATKPSVRGRLNAWGDKVLGELKERWNSPGFQKKFRFAVIGLVIASLIAAFLILRPRSKPDYLNDDLDDVLDYTLLTPDFNKLPLNERLALMKQLIERFKGMDGGDSALMAAFAAGLSKTALEQARQNMERLAVDLWDDFADRYTKVGKGDREAYLDNAFLEFTKLMEDTAGMTREKSDQDRMAEAKRQAQRDIERAPEPRMMTRDRAAPFLRLMQDRGQQVSSPEQRGRMAKFGRDMTRRLRGQDIDTGQPKTDPAPGSPAAGGDQAPGTEGDAGKETDPTKEKDKAKDKDKNKKKDGGKDKKPESGKDNKPTPPK